MTGAWQRMSRVWRLCSSGFLLGALLVGCSTAERASHCQGQPDFDMWETSLSGDIDPLVRAPGADGFADWSPNGERIAFIASRDGNCEIYLMDADGSDQVNVTNTRADELYPSWSPDGNRIVFTSSEAGSAQLFVLDLETGEQSQLTNSGLLHNFPDWSPDGSTIVFSGGTETAGPGVVHQIYAVSSSGGSERRLTEGDSLLVAPKWSPDGSQIAYFDHGDPFQIWVMDPNTGQSDLVGEGGHLAWAPGGKALVHDREVGAGDVDIFVNGDLLVDSPGMDTLPDWSPDGSTIVFSSDRP